jgi:hypothetical protein
MKRISIKMFIITALFSGIFCQPASAADYSAMTTEQLGALRGTMYNSPAQEQEAFRSAWLNRVEQMSEAEKQQYLRSGSGRGMGNRDGSGIGDGSGRGRGGAGNGGGNSSNSAGGGKGNGGSDSAGGGKGRQ